MQLDANTQFMEVAATPTLSDLHDLYTNGLYLQAYEQGQALGALKEWQGTSARLLAGRLAANLGAPRLARVLHALAFRHEPSHPEACYYFAWRIFERRGPRAAWVHLRECGELESAPDWLRADWYAMHGRVLSNVRDFELAETWQAKAEAISPDRPWMWVERSGLYESQDRRADAMAAVEHARTLRPWYRPAVQQAAHLLSEAGRDDDALDLLREACDRMESGNVWIQRAALAAELELHTEAAHCFERASDFFPLMEKAYGKWLYVRRSDAAYEVRDYPKAIELARASEEPLFVKLADELEKRSGDVPRVSLSVPFVRQHHVTCAPATLTSICNFWQVPADHVQIAERICFNGTPSQSERRWAEENGFAVREFTVTWESACALVDRGVPFTLTTVAPGAGHLQAVIGYDDCRRSLLIRDPGNRGTAEFSLESLLESHRATGPRGMAMAPRAQQSLLDELDLPDADLYDHLYTQQRALEEHDRPTAAAHADRMRELDANHRLTWLARRALASYDNDTKSLLECSEQLLAQFPDDVNLQLSRLSCLRELARRDERMAVLREKCHSTKTDPIYWQIYAQELLDDARERGEARRLLRRALRYRREDADVYRAWGNLLWDETPRDDALEFYRWACCLNDKDESLARSYFIACRHLKQTDVGLRMLRDRFARFGSKSAWPARTLCWALCELEATNEAFDVVEQAITLRPDDGDLLLYAADLHLRFNRSERAEELLKQAETRAHRIDVLRVRARMAHYRGDVSAALALYRELADNDPLNMEAQATVVGLMSDRDGVTAAIPYLREIVARFPFNYPLNQLLIEWLRSDDPRELEAAVRHLLEVHPVDGWAHRELAIALAKQDRSVEAFESAQLAAVLEPTNPSSFLVRGRLHHILGRIEAAQHDYREALRISVDTTMAMDELLRSCANDDDRRKQLEFIRDELARQTTFGDGLTNYREIARGLVPDESLLGVMRDAYAARPDLWQTWSALVAQLVDMKQLEEAAALMQQAVEKFPLLPRIWFDAALVCSARNDDAGELKALEQAIEINPTWGQGVRRLAELHERKGDLERAKAVLEQGVARDPSDGVNHGCLADALWRLGDQAEAIDRLKLALRLLPSYEWGWDTLGPWLKQQGRDGELVEFAKEIARSRPGEARNWLLVGRLLWQEDKADEALEALGRAIVINPLHVDAHELRAQVLAAQGKFDEAIAATRPPAWPDGPPRELRGRAVDIIAQQGNVPEAIAQMRTLLDESPDYVWGWFRLADWCEATKDGPGYLHASSQFAEHAPNSAMAFGYLGDAELRYGHSDAARKALERAVELDPAYVFAGTSLVNMLLKDHPDEAINRLESLRLAAPSPAVFELEVRTGIALHRQEIAMRGLGDLCQTENDFDGLRRAAMMLRDSRWRKQADKFIKAAIKPAGNPKLGPAWLALAPYSRSQARWVIGLNPKSELWRSSVEALLDELGNERRHEEVAWFIKKQGPLLRDDATLWALAGRALYVSGLYPRAIEWLKDWNTRHNVQPWMTLHLALAYAYWRLKDKAREVCLASLELPADHATPMHEVLLAAAEATDGELSQACARLEKIDPQPLGNWYQAIHSLVTTAGELLAEPAVARSTTSAARAHILRELGTLAKYINDDKVVCDLYRNLMLRIAVDRGSGFFSQWYRWFPRKL